jgi:hypothetical protein
MSFSALAILTNHAAVCASISCPSPNEPTATTSEDIDEEIAIHHDNLERLNENVVVDSEVPQHGGCQCLIAGLQTCCELVNSFLPPALLVDTANERCSIPGLKFVQSKQLQLF